MTPWDTLQPARHEQGQLWLVLWAGEHVARTCACPAHTLCVTPRTRAWLAASWCPWLNWQGTSLRQQWGWCMSGLEQGV
jgi:hypothetical protein